MALAAFAISEVSQRALPLGCRENVMSEINLARVAVSQRALPLRCREGTVVLMPKPIPARITACFAASLQRGQLEAQ